MRTLVEMLSDIDPTDECAVAVAVYACRSSRDAQSLWDHLLAKVSPSFAAGSIEVACLELDNPAEQYAVASLFDSVIPPNVFNQPEEV